MNQIDKELSRIKKKPEEMWALVEFQVVSCREALLTGDEELAKRIMKKGKKVNAYDLKIDRLCENFFALYNPVAGDLRWVLAILKITANLERIGDSAESVARMIKEAQAPVEPTLLAQSCLLEMMDATERMLANVRIAFLQEDTQLAREVLKQDKLLNKIHKKTDAMLLDYFKAYPQNIPQSLKVSGIIRKLERVGDQTTNIAEEIVFYVDAKVLKHKEKGGKKKKDKDQPDQEEI